MTDPDLETNQGQSEYNAPAGSWEQAALRQATVVITMPRAAVQALVRPPLPQIGQGPQGRMSEITVNEVLGALGRSNADNRTSFSGTSAGYSGSERNSQFGAPY